MAPRGMKDAEPVPLNVSQQASALLENRVLDLIPRAVALATALSSLQAAAGPPSLSDLERRVDSAYSIQAAQRHISAAQSGTSEARAAAGLEYLFQNVIGPRADLVTQANHGSRYSQSAGLGLPIFGTRSQQREAIDEALRNESDAAAELVDTRKALLLKLRESYVTYWENQRSADIDWHYLARAQHDLRPARSLVKSGFWTEGNLMDFLDTMSRLKSDLETQRSSGRAQLGAMRSVVGEDLQAFHAPDPDLDGCSPALDQIVARAVAADPDIAEIDAQITQYQQDLGLVKHSSATGTATVTAGTAVDPANANNGRSLAYSLNAGANLSMPTHGRSEERDKRAGLENSIAEQQYLRKQRIRDITAAAETALEDLEAARVSLDQSLVDQRSRLEDLREAQVKFQTQRMDSHPLFEDIQTALAENYTAEKTVVTDRATVWMKAASLLDIDPSACHPG